MKSIFEKKVETSTDMDGLVLCDECAYAKWTEKHKGTWYCKKLKKDIDYNTVDKYRTCESYVQGEPTIVQPNPIQNED